MATRETDDGWVELGSVAVGGGRRARIYGDGSGMVRWATGGSLGGAVGSDPFVAAVPDGTLAFGRVPAGAAEVEIGAPVPAREIVVSGGAFLAVLPAKLDSRHVVAVFRDEHGAIVRAPLPEHVRGRVLSRERVLDADIACRACGECEWEEVEVRAKPHIPVTRGRLTVCLVCGRIEGGERGAGCRRPHRDHDVAVAHGAAWLALLEPAEVVRAVGFTVYGLDPSRVRKTEFTWNGNPKRITGVGLQQKLARGEVEISSSLRRDGRHESALDPVAALASRLQIAAILADRASRRRSASARELAVAKHVRDADAGAANAVVSEVEISVEGQQHRFVVAEDSDRRMWCASGYRETVAIVMSGRACRPQSIRVVAIADPETYLPAAHLQRHDRR